MSAVRTALVAALLMIACAVGLQVSFLLVQAATILNLSPFAQPDTAAA